MTIPKPVREPKPRRGLRGGWRAKPETCPDCGCPVFVHSGGVCTSVLCERPLDGCERKPCKAKRVKKRSRKGASRAKLDRLMGQIVKAGGACEAQTKCAGIHPSKLVLQSAHGWGKKAYPAARYLRANLWCLCSRCHLYFTHHANEWVEWMRENMAPEVYARVRAIALANEKLDYKAIEADLRRQVAALKGE